MEGVPGPPQPAPGALKACARRWSHILAIERAWLFNIGLLLVVLYLGFKLTQSTTLIEPIRLGKAAEGRGWTSEAVSARVKFEVERIRSTFQDLPAKVWGDLSSAQREEILGRSSELDLDLPSVGFSVHSALLFAKDCVGQLSRVTGDIDDSLTLRIQATGDGGTTERAASMDEACETAAVYVLKRFSPLQVAAYLVDRDPARCRELLAEIRRERTLGSLDLRVLHNLQGIAAFCEGAFEEAIAEFQEAVRSDDGFAAAHNNWGLSLDKLGRREEAIARYKECLRRSPTMEEAHYNLGIALYRKGDEIVTTRLEEGRQLLEEAVASFHSGIRANPKEARCHNGCGNALDSLGRLEEAKQSYRIAAHLEPLSPIPLTNLAEVYLKQGKPKEAAVLLIRATKLNPKFTDAWADLGDARLVERKWEEAAKAFAKAVELDPNRGSSWTGWAISLTEVGATLDALGKFELAVARSKGPGLLKALLGHAKVCRTLGRIGDCEASLRSILRQSPDSEEAKEATNLLGQIGTPR